MPQITHVSAQPGDVLLLVGTMKGAFILRSDASRTGWDVGGPYFPGSAVYAMAYDRRGGRQRIWAGPNSMHWGGVLRSSDDFGAGVVMARRAAGAAFDMLGEEADA